MLVEANKSALRESVWRLLSPHDEVAASDGPEELARTPDLTPALVLIDLMPLRPAVARVFATCDSAADRLSHLVDSATSQAAESTERHP